MQYNEHSIKILLVFTEARVQFEVIFKYHKGLLNHKHLSYLQLLKTGSLIIAVREFLLA